jgi:putative transposase
MSRAKRQKSCSASLLSLLDDGPALASLASAGQQAISDVTTFLRDCKTFPGLQSRISYMLEYLVQNRETILRDRQILCMSASRTTRLSATSALGSISSEKVCSPFWKEHSKAVSDRLSWPAGTASAGSPSSSSNGCLPGTAQASWFSTHTISPPNKSSQTTSCPLSKYFAVGEMADADTDVVRVRQVKLKPDKRQQKLLQEYAAGGTWTYNESVRMLSRDNKTTKQTLRNRLVTEKGNGLLASKAWLLKTPKVVRQQAAFRAKAAQKSAVANLSAGHIKHFRLRFSRKKDREWTIGLEKQLRKTNSQLTILKQTIGAIKHVGLLPSFEDDGKPRMECSLHHTASGEYFLCVPEKKRVATVDGDTRPAVALDPGARKFLVSFASDGMCQALGSNVTEVMVSLLEKLDLLRELELSRHGRRRRAARRARMRVYRRMRNLQDELHYKLCAWLTENYSTIIMPTFNVHTVARKETSSLRAKTKRVFFALSHARFRGRLREKCQERGCVLLEPDERYTSKTCGRCGLLNVVGASETFRCRHCGATADRDANAARNILLKCIEPVHLAR